MVSFPKSEWINNWGIDNYSANSLYKHILQTKPKIVLETGTFEAQATYVMASACNINNNKCIIYTIDYDGDPTSELELSKWLLLKQIRNKNLDKIQKQFKNVKVIFCDGDSRNVLKTLMTDNNINKVDLFYQDSMHFFEGIKNEWDLVEPYIKKNCYTIFDDLKLKGVKKFRTWFKLKYKNKYLYQEIHQGHKQFIIKKV